MESYSVQAVLSAVDKGFTSSMNSAGRSLNGIESSSGRATSSIMKIAGGIGVFKALSAAGNTLKNSLDGAIDRFDTMNKFPKVMEQIGFSFDVSNKSIQRLSDGIQGLPTSLDSITATTQKIAILTRDLDKATSTSLALNNAFLASGSATADAERGLVQYTQMLSKGSVDIVSWRTLQETMGPALYDLAMAFGYAGESAQNDLYDALKYGEITFDQFNDKLIEMDTRVGGFAERAKTASGGIKTSLSNMGLAVVRGLEGTIRAIDDGLVANSLPNLRQMVEIMSQNINKCFKKIQEGAQVAVGAMAAGIDIVTNNLDFLIPLVGTAAGAFVAYKVAVMAASKIEKFQKEMKEAQTIITAVKSVTQLKTKADLANQKAVKASATAELWSNKAKAASVKATQAKTIANNLAKKAEQAKAAAVAAGGTSEALNTKAELAGAAATQAKEVADKKAIYAKKAKTVASNAEAKAAAFNASAEIANTAATEAGTTAAGLSSVAIAAKTAILGVLSGKLGLVAAAQMVWNTAMAVSPIGAIVALGAALTAVTAGVVVAIGRLNGKHQELLDTHDKVVASTKETVDAINESISSYEDERNSIHTTAKANKDLVKQIEELSKKENKDAEDKAVLQSKIKALNSSVEGLGLAYDSETDSLNMGSEAINKRIGAYEKIQKAQLADERLIPLLKEQEEAQKALTEAVNHRKEIEKQMEEDRAKGPAQLKQYTGMLEEAKEAESQAIAKKEALATQQQALDTAVADGARSQAAAVSESVESQKISLEDLDETQQATLDRIVEAYGTMTSGLSDLSDKIKLDSETTWSKVQKNQADTISKTQEFADLYSQAINAGVSESYLDAIGATGPEALPLLRSMMESGVEEVLDAQGQWESAYNTIGDSFTNSLQMGDEERSAIREYISGQSGVLGTLQNAIDTADFSSIGKNINNTMADSISGNTEPVYNSGVEMGDQTGEGSEFALEIGSPSRRYMQYGIWTVEGFVNGLNSQSGLLNMTMQQIMGTAGQVAMKAMQDSINRMSTITSTSFNGISSAARIGMSKMAAEIADGSKKSLTAMQNAMKAMNAAVQSSMRSMQQSSTSGMRAMAKAIESGINSAKDSVSKGCSKMVSVADSLRDSFHVSGYYASIGLAQGINAGASHAIEAAERLANTVHKTINNALQIKSPSRVTRESGIYAGEGLALGLLDKIRRVRNAALEIAEAAVPTGDIARKAAQAGAYTVNANYAYAGGAGATYTIIVPVEVDGKVIAKVTAPYTQEELEKLETRNSRRRGYR